MKIAPFAEHSTNGIPSVSSGVKNPKQMINTQMRLRAENAISAMLMSFMMTDPFFEFYCCYVKQCTSISFSRMRTGSLSSRFFSGSLSFLVEHVCHVSFCEGVIHLSEHKTQNGSAQNGMRASRVWKCRTATGKIKKRSKKKSRTLPITVSKGPAKNLLLSCGSARQDVKTQSHRVYFTWDRSK